MYITLGVLGLAQLCKTLFKINDTAPDWSTICMLEGNQVKLTYLKKTWTGTISIYRWTNIQTTFYEHISISFYVTGNKSDR